MFTDNMFHLLQCDICFYMVRFRRTQYLRLSTEKVKIDKEDETQCVINIIKHSTKSTSFPDLK